MTPAPGPKPGSRTNPLLRWLRLPVTVGLGGLTAMVELPFLLLAGLSVLVTLPLTRTALPAGRRILPAFVVRGADALVRLEQRRLGGTAGGVRDLAGGPAERPTPGNGPGCWAIWRPACCRPRWGR